MPRTLRLTPALVATLPTSIPDPGPIAEVDNLKTEEALAQTLSTVLSTRPDPEQLWIFAFGSLMWKPDIAFEEQRRARVSGWHRAFCLGPDTRYRGSPEFPGIMMSLDQGGACEGVVFRLDEANLPATLATLIEREPPIPPTWVQTETAQGPVSALAFVCVPGGLGYVGDHTPQAIAQQIAPEIGRAHV